MEVKVQFGRDEIEQNNQQISDKKEKGESLLMGKMLSFVREASCH